MLLDNVELERTPGIERQAVGFAQISKNIALVLHGAILDFQERERALARAAHPEVPELIKPHHPAAGQVFCKNGNLEARRDLQGQVGLVNGLGRDGVVGEEPRDVRGGRSEGRAERGQVLFHRERHAQDGEHADDNGDFPCE